MTAGAGVWIVGVAVTGCDVKGGLIGDAADLAGGAAGGVGSGSIPGLMTFLGIGRLLDMAGGGCCDGSFESIGVASRGRGL